MATESARVIGARHLARLCDHLEANEPASTQALANVTDLGLRHDRVRAWTIGSDDAVVAGVVSTKMCVDRWETFACCTTPAAAASVARVVDRAPGVVLVGLERQLVDVLPLVTRLRYARRARFVAGTALGGDPPDDRTRVATMRDLPAIVELYRSYGIGLAATGWQLKAIVRRHLRFHLVVVLEVGGELIGATAYTGRSRRFLVGDDLVVRADRRGEGWARVLATRTEAIARALGLPWSGVMFPTNPMHVEDGLREDDTWIYAILERRPAIKGWGRAKDLVMRWDALPEPVLTLHRSFDLLPVGSEYAALRSAEDEASR